jgi:hypothetical protein
MKSLLCTLVLGLFVALGSASAQTTAPALDSTTVKEFLGKYDTGGMGHIIVSWEQNKMIGTLEGQGSAPLVPTSTVDVFSIEGYDGTATFTRDADKKVIKVTLSVQGQTIEAAKL